MNLMPNKQSMMTKYWWEAAGCNKYLGHLAMSTKVESSICALESYCKLRTHTEIHMYYFIQVGKSKATRCDTSHIMIWVLLATETNVSSVD